ncbi:MAG: hypothetical protein U5L10_05440 [Candidatus Moranbacteria bacterium]|nr:hypothetical protein [Candidatus Moranbacteria bacterium]
MKQIIFFSFFSLVAAAVLFSINSNELLAQNNDSDVENNYLPIVNQNQSSSNTQGNSGQNTATSDGNTQNDPLPVNTPNANSGSENNTSGGNTQGGNTTGASYSNIPVPTDQGLPDPEGGIMAIIKNFLDWLLTVFVILAVIAFVVTGLMYIFSLGNARSPLLENAKNYFQYATIAVIVAGAGYIIIKSIDLFLRGELPLQ